MCKGDAENLADKTREVLSSLEGVTRDLENISDSRKHDPVSRVNFNSLFHATST